MMQDNTAPPPLGPLLESSIYVADLEASAAFYRGLFGWPEFLRDGRMRALGVPGAAVLLLFVRDGSERGSASPVGFIPGHGATGRMHLCFKIAADDLERWAVFLSGRGIVVESRITWPAGGTSLYFRDPDQHSIELATPGLWPNY